MKKIIISLTVLSFVVLSMASAITDKADLGPFVAYFDIGTPAGSNEITINPPIQLQDHNQYWFRVTSTDISSRFIDVYIDDYGKEVDVSTNRLTEMVSEMMDLWKEVKDLNVKWDPVATIGGRPAVAAKLIKSDGSTYYESAAYSPDGVGSYGTILVELDSFYPEKETAAFMEHLQIQRQ